MINTFGNDEFKGEGGSPQPARTIHVTEDNQSVTVCDAENGETIVATVASSKEQ